MLLLINGAPGVGKSTLAQRFAGEHPLALIVDIDTIRTQLGQWAMQEASRLVARDLGAELARAHLSFGYDVIVAQYLGRPEYRERLRDLTHECGVPFVEVVLTDDAARIAQRFRDRRAGYLSAGFVHPEGDLSDDAVESEVQQANDALLRDAATRAVPVIAVGQGEEAAYLALSDVIANRH